eukprot:TRINITY_DN1508_c0_g1_i3.p1 TRINITY_DN1508_c0_g1~~TRINITY_DN1508_c0_g1_i3.p1  ORF type:complete len:1264 (+),score=239.93 TRINITY_DN1508_c0_g1_i3:104-3895(+)
MKRKASDLEHYYLQSTRPNSNWLASNTSHTSSWTGFSYNPRTEENCKKNNDNSSQRPLTTTNYTLQSLPPTIIIKSLLLIGQESIKALAQLFTVCKAWSHLCRSNQIWKPLYCQFFCPYTTLSSIQEVASWFEAFSDRFDRGGYIGSRYSLSLLQPPRPLKPYIIVDREPEFTTFRASHPTDLFSKPQKEILPPNGYSVLSNDYIIVTYKNLCCDLWLRNESTFEQQRQSTKSTSSPSSPSAIDLDSEYLPHAKFLKRFHLALPPKWRKKEYTVHQTPQINQIKDSSLLLHLPSGLLLIHDILPVLLPCLSYSSSFSSTSNLSGGLCEHEQIVEMDFKASPYNFRFFSFYRPDSNFYPVPDTPPPASFPLPLDVSSSQVFFPCTNSLYSTGTWVPFERLCTTPIKLRSVSFVPRQSLLADVKYYSFATSANPLDKSIFPAALTVDFTCSITTAFHHSNNTPEGTETTKAIVWPLSDNSCHTPVMFSDTSVSEGGSIVNVANRIDTEEADDTDLVHVVVSTKNLAKQTYEIDFNNQLIKLVDSFHPPQPKVQAIIGLKLPAKVNWSVYDRSFIKTIIVESAGKESLFWNQILAQNTPDLSDDIYKNIKLVAMAWNRKNRRYPIGIVLDSRVDKKNDKQKVNLIPLKFQLMDANTLLFVSGKGEIMLRRMSWALGGRSINQHVPFLFEMHYKDSGDQIAYITEFRKVIGKFVTDPSFGANNNINNSERRGSSNGLNDNKNENEKNEEKDRGLSSEEKGSITNSLLAGISDAQCVNLMNREVGVFWCKKLNCPLLIDFKAKPYPQLNKFRRFYHHHRLNKANSNINIRSTCIKEPAEYDDHYNKIQEVADATLYVVDYIHKQKNKLTSLVNKSLQYDRTFNNNTNKNNNNNNFNNNKSSKMRKNKVDDEILAEMTKTIEFIDEVEEYLKSKFSPHFPRFLKQQLNLNNSNNTATAGANIDPNPRGNPVKVKVFLNNNIYREKKLLTLWREYQSKIKTMSEFLSISSTKQFLFNELSVIRQTLKTVFLDKLSPNNDSHHHHKKLQTHNLSQLISKLWSFTTDLNDSLSEVSIKSFLLAEARSLSYDQLHIEIDLKSLSPLQFLVQIGDHCLAVFTRSISRLILFIERLLSVQDCSENKIIRDEIYTLLYDRIESCLNVLSYYVSRLNLVVKKEEQIALVQEGGSAGGSLGLGGIEGMARGGFQVLARLEKEIEEGVKALEGVFRNVPLCKSNYLKEAAVSSTFDSLFKVLFIFPSRYFFFYRSLVRI